MKKKILHVTECFAGGVSRAIVTRVKATPEFEHHLLWSGDEAPSTDLPFASVQELPYGTIRRTKSVSKVLKALSPEVVHAHSSWAGLYTRLLPLPIPVVYEPHCFKFDDPELDRLRRFVFRTAEKFLANRTAAFGVLTEHEKALATNLDARIPTRIIPNIATFSGTAVKSSPATDDSIHVTMIGRLARQKDPDFFIRTVDHLREISDRPVQAVWIGDGEKQLRDECENSGVQVTGWLSASEVRNELQRSNVYIHSASYEGFPLSVLDAATAGTPIVARDIAPFKQTELLQASTPDQLAHLAFNTAIESTTRKQAIRAGELLLEQMNEHTLSLSLQELYKMVNEAHSKLKTDETQLKHFDR